MRSEILSKLRSELNKDIKRESQVLYILVEIRKLLEGCSIRKQTSYSNLYFFCNWVLHRKMDRTPAVQILQRFESLLKETNINDVDDIFYKLIEKESRFYLLIDLKGELKRFLELNKFPTKLVANRKKWDGFRYYLLQILTNCPLIQKEGKIIKFFFMEGRKKNINFAIEIAGKGTYAIDLVDQTEDAFNRLGHKY